MGTDKALGITRRSVIGWTGAAVALPAAPFPPVNLENRRMAFTPIFVDLVRNTTTTQGTGNFVLGAAVSGYTGFAAALQPGDSFYYSALGVDKPAEREVGRGTLLANGTVSREAVSGALTSFSSGTKTLSLIAPAEWFSSVQSSIAAQGSAKVAMASRAALAAADNSVAALLLTEPGREGMFVWDGSNLAAKVTADSAQAMHVAPASDPTGASGAWVRRYTGPIQVDWFGAIGDDLANDGAAAMAAISFAGSQLARAYGFGTHPAPIVEFGPKAYFLGTTTLDLDRTIILQGQSTFHGSGATTLRWAAGSTGIRVQGADTIGATGTQSIQAHRGDGSIIRNLYLRGAFSGIEAEAHGVHLRARAIVRDCFIDNFEGDGIFVNADTNTVKGNADGFQVENVAVSGCRDGIYIAGDVTNAGKVASLDVSGCRRWGINEQSFIGNTYVACQVASCGEYDAAPSMVSYAGNRYAVKHGQASGAATSAPSGTTADSAQWRYVSAGGVAPGFPAWTAGIAAREGGAYNAPALGAFNEFLGCYVEGATTVSYISAPSKVWGGTLASYFGILRGGGSDVQMGSSSAFGTDPSDFNLSLDNFNIFSSLSFRSFGSGSWHTDGYIKTQSLIGITVEGKQTVVIRTTDDGEIAQFIDGWLYLSQLGLNHLGTLKVNGGTGVKLQYNGADQLTIGNATASFAGSVLAASIAASGTVTSSGGKMGYATGAGGTVAQATSKSTGVTLNKYCGQITLNGAALAANTTVNFVMTNSNIAAGDLLILNHVSGGTGGAYSLNAQCGAGTASINVRNVTAGSLSEAIVIGFALQKAVTA